ncbi:MAG: phosphotransferase [Chloroflexi bacterium]|nr:phosphotransferase [Chloroflexota bacterium]
MSEQIEQAIRAAGLFRGDRVLATERMAQGKASTVYRVWLRSGRDVVFKSAPASVVETEALWLRGWQTVGVETPEVYAHGVLPDGTPYLLMEFVAGPSVESEIAAGRLQYDETQRRIGRMLAAMHAVRAEGFGWAGEDHLDEAGRGCFATLREQLAAEKLPRGLRFALEVGAISEQDLGAVERAVDVLSEHVLLTGSRRTHGDFRTGNMLLRGERLVVIDPSPAATHPYICVAYSVLLEELEAGALPVSFLEGYGEVWPIDARALDAALLIRAGIMFDSFGRRRETECGRRLPSVFARLRTPFA